jgi:hypothetical protein
VQAVRSSTLPNASIVKCLVGCIKCVCAFVGKS